MVLKSEIENDIYFKYQAARVRALHTDRIDCIHVSDLIKECKRYVVYDKITPPEYKSSNTEEMKSLFFGQILHKTVILDEKRNEIPLLYDWTRDVGFSEDMAELDDGNRWNYLAGSIDDLIQVKGEWVIVDKKTTGSIDWFRKKDQRPNEYHKAQINFYRVLLKKCLGIDAKWGCNIYISNCIDNEKRDAPAVIPYKLNDIDKTMPLLTSGCQEIKTYMTQRKLPQATKNFLCDGMCPYAWPRCFTETKTSW